MPAAYIQTPDYFYHNPDQTGSIYLLHYRLPKYLHKAMVIFLKGRKRINLDKGYSI